MRRKSVLFAAGALLLLFVAASTVYAQDGTGGGDKFVFGQNYVLQPGETLSGSLAVLGGNAELAEGSTVAGDVFVAGGKLSVSGVIQGSVAVFGGATVLADTAVVEGDFATFGGAVSQATGATIRGQIFSGLGSRRGARSPESPVAPATPEVPAAPSAPQTQGQTQPFGGLRRMIAWEIAAVSSALMLVVLGIIVVVLAPKAIGRVASAAASQPALSFGAGILTLVVGLLGGLLLLIACGLGILLWLALIAAMLFGWIGVGLWLGQRIFAALKMRSSSSLLEVALGIFVITLVANLPWCIGFLFTAVVGSIGLGAVVLTRFGRQPAADPGRPIPPAPVRLEDLDAEVLAPVPPPALPAPAPVEPPGPNEGAPGAPTAGQ